MRSGARLSHHRLRHLAVADGGDAVDHEAHDTYAQDAEKRDDIRHQERKEEHGNDHEQKIDGTEQRSGQVFRHEIPQTQGSDQEHDAVQDEHEQQRHDPYSDYLTGNILAPGYRFRQNARLRPVVPVAPEYAHGKQRRDDHHARADDVEGHLGHGPDNDPGIDMLPVHHVISVVAAADKKHAQGADGEHDDETLLPYFVEKGVSGNPGNGRERFRHFHINLSPVVQTRLPAYRRP